MKVSIEDILKGDEGAVVTFYNEYSPKLLRYIEKKVSPEDAQEILQDVFLHALDSLIFYKKQCSLSTWLYTIAHNKIVDFYRKKRIKSLILSQFPFLQPIAEEIHEPEFQYEKNKLRDKIEITFHKLSKKYREILRMHYEKNMSVKQIALELNISFKAAESLLYRARMQFMNEYER